MPEIPQKAVQAAAETERRVRCSHTLGASCAECRARAALEAALKILTPSEMIRRLFPSARWGNPEWRAVKDALAGEGFAVVAMEDLRSVAEIAENYLDMCEPPPAGDLARVARLRAALPERTNP